MTPLNTLSDNSAYSILFTIQRSSEDTFTPTGCISFDLYALRADYTDDTFKGIATVTASPNLTASFTTVDFTGTDQYGISLYLEEDLSESQQLFVALKDVPYPPVKRNFAWRLRIYPDYSYCNPVFYEFFLSIGTIENMLRSKKLSVTLPYAVESCMDLVLSPVSGIILKETAETDCSDILSATNIEATSKCKIENKSLHITSGISNATNSVQFMIKTMEVEENVAFSLSIYTGTQKNFEYIFNGKSGLADHLSFSILGIILILLTSI